MLQRIGRIGGDAIGEALRGLRDIAIPPICLTCDRLVDTQGGLCSHCWSRARFIERPYCEVLGLPFSFDPGEMPGERLVSARAIADPPPFERLRAVMTYDDYARRLVGGLKYADRGDLAPWMARWMATAGRELLADCEIVIPVPLHRLRLHRRRANQSAELARNIARLAGLDYQPQALLRHRRTRQQVGLSSLERARNVQGAFRVDPRQRMVIENRRVLLVDDVHTTGATVRACSRALRRAGAGAIDVLVFASVAGDDI